LEVGLPNQGVVAHPEAIMHVPNTPDKTKKAAIFRAYFIMKALERIHSTAQGGGVDTCRPHSGQSAHVQQRWRVYIVRHRMQRRRRKSIAVRAMRGTVKAVRMKEITSAVARLSEKNLKNAPVTPDRTASPSSLYYLQVVHFGQHGHRRGNDARGVASRAGRKLCQRASRLFAATAL
jgi:hypothetical protein